MIAQEFLWAEEVEEIKSKSLSNKKNTAANPWNTNEDAMWRKSPVRRMAKWMPMSSEMQTAARIEEAQEEGREIPLDINLEDAIGDAPPPTGVDQKTDAKAQALKDKLQAAQTQAGGPAGAKSLQATEPGVEGAEATPDPHQPQSGEVVDAEYVPEEEAPLPLEPPGPPLVADPPHKENQNGPAETSGDPPAPPQPPPPSKATPPI
jgi:recombination protein RecT